MIKSIANSFENELKNMAPESNESLGGILADTGLNIISKKNKKELL